MQTSVLLGYLTDKIGADLLAVPSEAAQAKFLLLTY